MTAKTQNKAGSSTTRQARKRKSERAMNQAADKVAVSATAITDASVSAEQAAGNMTAAASSATEAATSIGSTGQATAEAIAAAGQSTTELVSAAGDAARTAAMTALII